MVNRWINRLNYDTMVKIFCKRGGSDWFLHLEGCMSDRQSIETDQDNFLCISDGTLLSLNLHNLIWKIDVITQGSSFISHDVIPDQHDAVLVGCDIKWIVFGDTIFTEKKLPERKRKCRWRGF